MGVVRTPDPPGDHRLQRVRSGTGHLRKRPTEAVRKERTRNP
jgi:hypothetical protein